MKWNFLYKFLIIYSFRRVCTLHVIKLGLHENLLKMKEVNYRRVDICSNRIHDLILNTNVPLNLRRSFFHSLIRISHFQLKLLFLLIRFRFLTIYIVGNLKSTHQRRLRHVNFFVADKIDCTVTKLETKTAIREMQLPRT